MNTRCDSRKVEIKIPGDTKEHERSMLGLTMDFPSEIMSPSPHCIANAVQSVVQSSHEVFEVCVRNTLDDDISSTDTATEDCETIELLETIAQLRKLRAILIQQHQRQSPEPRGLVGNDCGVVLMDFSSRDHLTHDDHLCLVRFNHVDIREKRTRVEKQQSDF